MRILLINNSDIGGGAESIVQILLKELNQKGYTTTLLVGKKISDDPNIFQITNPNNNSIRESIWIKIEELLKKLPYQTLHNPRYISLLRTLFTRTSYFFDSLAGNDLLPYPTTYTLLDNLPLKPDILHLNNLHEDYFDIRAIPQLSKKIPVFVTIHDFWLMTGYCASFFSCMEWKKGCINCQIRSTMGNFFPSAFNQNWELKKEIFSNSHLHIITPSKWALNNIEKSIIRPAIIDSRVIPHGIKTDIFCPVNKEKIRNNLMLPQYAKILLMTSKGGFDNQKFDWDMLKESLKIVSQEYFIEPVIVLILGGMNRREIINSIVIQEVPFQNEIQKIVQYYQAADLYIHTSKDETFGMSILEAMSCGLPVVTSGTGAIPELIEDQKTGIIIQNKLSSEMAHAILDLLNNREMYEKMSVASRKRTLKNYSVETMVSNHIEYYHEVINRYEEN